MAYKYRDSNPVFFHAWDSYGYEEDGFLRTKDTVPAEKEVAKIV